jgi:hypothetical protein
MRAYLILSDVTVLGLTPRVNQHFARGYIRVGGPFVDTAKLLYQAIHSKTAVT